MHCLQPYLCSNHSQAFTSSKTLYTHISDSQKKELIKTNLTSTPKEDENVQNLNCEYKVIWYPSKKFFINFS